MMYPMIGTSPVTAIQRQDFSFSRRMSSQTSSSVTSHTMTPATIAPRIHSPSTTSVS